MRNDPSRLTKLLSLSRKIDCFTNAVGKLAYWLVLVMIGVGVWNVLGRYLGNAIGQNLSSNALIETQWYLFDMVFLLGAAYALQHNEHVRVDVFYARWSRRHQALADLMGTLLFLLPFSALVLWFSWGAVAKSWAVFETSPDPGGLPRYPIKTMILVSFALLILQGISDAIKNWAIYTGALPPDEDAPDSGPPNAPPSSPATAPLPTEQQLPAPEEDQP